MKETLPSWVDGLKAKRPLEWIRCLTYLLEAGIRNGQCTANDIPDGVEFAEPNVIGANFKDLKRFGFKKTYTTVKAIIPRKHGRDLPIWTLEDTSTAIQFLSKLKNLAFQNTGRIEQQNLL